ncbi:hypothetical protein PROFUN_17070, partial [Planoprotostelium fungivorum]
PEAVINSFGNDCLGALIIMLSIANIPTRRLNTGYEELQNYIEDIFGIDMTIPTVTSRMVWQDFEKIIAQYQALRIWLLKCVGDDCLLPGALLKLQWNVAVSEFPQYYVGDKHHCVLENPPQFSPEGQILDEHSQLQLPPGIFKCGTNNPTVDIRVMAYDQDCNCCIVWERLKHTGSSVKVSLDDIKEFYSEAKTIHIDPKIRPKGPRLVFITNTLPEFSKQDIDNLLERCQDLAVITGDQMYQFLPIYLAEAVLATWNE